jgi:hypothetical protein
MAKSLALLLSLLAGDGLAGARDCEPPDRTTAAAAARALNDAYIAAARAHDVAWFERHMAADALIVLGTGARLGKAEFLARLRDDPRPYRSLTVRNVSVRVFGVVVQVDADAPWELTDGRAGVSRYIDTYAWLDCRWQVISAQVTPLPATPPD